MTYKARRGAERRQLVPDASPPPTIPIRLLNCRISALACLKIRREHALIGPENVQVRARALPKPLELVVVYEEVAAEVGLVLRLGRLRVVEALEPARPLRPLRRKRGKPSLPQSERPTTRQNAVHRP